MKTRDRLEEVGRNIDKNGKFEDDGKKLLNDYITKEELWACTTCNACTEACPVLLDPAQALARIAGETAPLLFTALSNQFFSLDLGQPMANLPVTIFKFAMSPFTNWQELAWAGVFLITLGVLALNILARVLFRQKN